MSFAEVKMVVTRGELHRLGRSPKEQQRYEKFRLQIESEWTSFTDYILAEKLGLSSTRSNAEGGKQTIDRMVRG